MISVLVRYLLHAESSLLTGSRRRISRIQYKTFCNPLHKDIANRTAALIAD
jgi:hypothetical protein